MTDFGCLLSGRHRLEREWAFDPSLRLYLPLWKKNGATFTDDSAYGHLATATGALWTPQGRTFDGIDDLIDMGNPAALANITETITVEAWVKPSDIEGPTIVGKYSDTLVGWALYLANNKIYFDVNDGVGGETNSDSNLVIATGSWSHVAVTYDKISIIHYRAGVAVRTEASIVEIGAVSTSLIIGTDGTAGASTFFSGTIGEVRIYSRVLTPLEIQRNYLNSKWRYV